MVGHRGQPWHRMADQTLFINPFRGAPMLAMVLALCGPCRSMAQAAAGATAVPLITAISLERDCSACPTGSVLLLQRDGSAVLNVTGKSRHGTQDSMSRGTLRVEDFDTLAHFVTAQGFFEMGDSYADAELQDGTWAATIVTGDGAAKRVFRREDAGPAALKAVEAAITAVQARISFVPTSR